MAKSLPLIVTPATPDTQLAELIAGAVQPSETIGSAALALIQNKPDIEDMKVVIAKPGGIGPCRIVLVPSSKANGDLLFSEEALLATIVRDDNTKDTSTHTSTVEAGTGADPINVAITAALAAAKPARSFSGLLNALGDAIDAIGNGVGAGVDVSFVFDQTGDGSVKVYKNTGVNDGINGQLADVTQQDAPANPTALHIW